MNTLNPKWLLLSIGLIWAGCGSDDKPTDITPEPSTAQLDDQNDVNESAAQESFVSSMVYASTNSSDPVTAADNFGSQLSTFKAASSTQNAENLQSVNTASIACVTSQHEHGTNVVYLILTDCTGRFGLLNLTGKIKITYNAIPGFGGDAGTTAKIRAVLTSESTGGDAGASEGLGLTLNGKPVTYNATADIQIQGDIRTVTTNAVWQRKNALGETVKFTTTNVVVTINKTTKCRTVTGSTATDIGTRHIGSTFTNVTVCRASDGSDHCPKQGGSIKHSMTVIIDGVTRTREYTVTFNGDDSAIITWQGATGGVRCAGGDGGLIGARCVSIDASTSGGLLIRLNCTPN